MWLANGTLQPLPLFGALCHGMLLHMQSNTRLDRTHCQMDPSIPTNPKPAMCWLDCLGCVDLASNPRGAMQVPSHAQHAGLEQGMAVNRLCSIIISNHSSLPSPVDHCPDLCFRLQVVVWVA